MKLRTRDIVAAVLSILLVRIAWTNTDTTNGRSWSSFSESLTVGITLAFYADYKSSAFITDGQRQKTKVSSEEENAAGGDGRKNKEPVDSRGNKIRTARPIPLDVDGDGIVEAIVVPSLIENHNLTTTTTATVTNDNSGNALQHQHQQPTRWGLKVLDLKPLHAAYKSKDSGHLDLSSLPFYPQTMFSTSPQRDTHRDDHRAESRTALPIIPIRMTSGQIILHPPAGRHSTPYITTSKSQQQHQQQTQEEDEKSNPNYDRTRHYFCGTDWFDASKNCREHCPSGSSADCPDGQMCYADTPCDSQKQAPSSSSSSSQVESSVTKDGAVVLNIRNNVGDDGKTNGTKTLMLTPAGGLPSIATVWSDGSMTLHVLTGVVEKEEEEEEEKSGRKRGGRKKKRGEAQVELLELWKMRPFRTTTLLEEREKKEDNNDGTEASNGEEEEKRERLQQAGSSSSTAAALNNAWLDFHEIDVQILDSTAPIGQRGAIIVTARYRIHRMGDEKEYEDKDGDDDEYIDDDQYLYEGQGGGGGGETIASYHAIDVVNGQIIWSSEIGDFAKKDEDEDEAKEKENKDETMGEKPIVDRVWSSARRRSHVPTISLAATGGKDEDGESSVSMDDCLHLFRHSVLDPASGALPHVYWGSGREDARLVVSHFDRRHHGSRGAGGGGAVGRGALSRRRRSRSKVKVGEPKGKLQKAVLDKVKPVLPTTHRKKRTKKIHRASNTIHGAGTHDVGHSSGRLPMYGRPNVILSHHRGGIHALSLRNGKPVCHLSLLDRGLYADINNDGVIDHVQVITDPAVGGGTGKWVRDLVQRVTGDGVDKEKYKNILLSLGGRNRLCHALALSGIPAKEEIYSVPLCGDIPLFAKQKGERNVVRPGLRVPPTVSSAPPLVVEDSEGTSTSNDVVFAMSNGMVSRFDAHGKRLWKTRVDMDGMPTWGQDSASTVALLGRINFAKAVMAPAVRPLLVVGEDGMAVLSSGKGRMLASTTFPQSSVSRPILADVSGDGTTDVLIVSTDAVWGYTVTVRTGGSIFLRIMVGLVFVSIGAAALRNKFATREGVDKRSTDE